MKQEVSSLRLTMGGIPIVISAGHQFLLDELIAELGPHPSPPPNTSLNEINISFTQREEFFAELAEPRGRREFFMVTPELGLMIDYERFQAKIIGTQGCNLDEALLVIVGTLGFLLTLSLSQRGKVTSFHAASLSREGKGVMLPGDTGAGKTSISYILINNGFEYLSDEQSILFTTGDGSPFVYEIIGLRRRIRLIAEGEEGESPFGISLRGGRKWKAFGQHGWLIDPINLKKDIYTESSPLCSIIILRNQTGISHPSLKKLSRSQAYFSLLAAADTMEALGSPRALHPTFRKHNRESFHLIGELVENFEVLELQYDLKSHYKQLPAIIMQTLN